ncbi:MAG TPA: 1-aminocyclopropane-1-carboxylate deaminase/D-cysteine desulfhydrase [Sulfurospirillum arcachonense]|nr:1-aminocyclopropane-1-carboxylate deaminase/D-cysteine desulfhydrase [Sulfurospirillum arcachonense]HIP44709.1 1-aminocyclopropane-1-carboxylate deaminase/D-cysteine desulfhydrase [Sulfurospirillum arcachonense]
MTFSPSPFQKHTFRGREIYVKRDDALHVDFSGNKARKFHWFLNQEFVHVKRVVSYGSNQSNAMYSLSVMARYRGWEFVYFCNHIPDFLKQNPVGNYKYALENGMKIIESLQRREDAYMYTDSSDLIIEEGGRQKEAEFGVKVLADELKKDIQKEGIKNPYIYLPSGTGTTALFLQKNLPYRVFTCSTVGDDEYLKEQFEEISEDSFPVILSSQKKYHYGKLYPELYELWQELQEDMGITFDLMYDPVGWQKFLLHVEDLEGTPIYIHQGGVLGNESMKQRYERKYETDKNNR